MGRSRSYTFRSRRGQITIQLGTDDFSLTGAGEGQEWPPSFTHMNMADPVARERLPAVIDLYESTDVWRLVMWMAEGQSRPAGLIRAAASDLEALFGREGSKLQYRYQFAMSDGGCGRGMSTRIGNDYWIFDSGPGRAEMKMVAPGVAGMPAKVIKSVDLRGIKEVDTDRGVVTITKRRIHPTWPTVLASLREFLDPLPKDELVQIEMEAPEPTISELVLMYREGGGADDDAMEILAARGEPAREELFAMLSGKRPLDIRLTAAEMLQLGFPGEETSERLRQLAAKSKNALFREGIRSVIDALKVARNREIRGNPGAATAEIRSIWNETE